MMTNQEISTMLAPWQAECLCVDANYFLPDRTWIKEVFGPALMANLAALGIKQYITERNDCDKFAVNARALMQELHARANGGAAGCAFGFLAYVTDAGGGHCINFAIVNDNGVRNVMFFEPQLGVEVQLSDKEKETIQWYYI